MSRLSDSATATLTLGMAQQLSKWNHRHNQSAYSPKWKKSSEVYRRNNNGTKTLPCVTPETLTSLLRQPSTITCCDRFDIAVSIYTTQNLQYPQNRSYTETLMVDPIKGCAEINLYDPSLLPTLQCTLQCMRHAQKSIIGTQTFPVSKLGGWKHTTAFHKSSQANRHQVLKHL